MRKNCLDCGQPLAGRSDKKFCSDHCRNNNHNKRGRIVNNLVRRINRRLSNNRRILFELNPVGCHTVTREMLEIKGFDFSLFTTFLTFRNDEHYFFCYDQGYCLLSDGESAAGGLVKCEIVYRSCCL